MKLVLFGATGNLGPRILAEMLQRGLEVTAFVRQAGKLAPRDRLSLAMVDVRDTAPVARAIAGHDAVVSALGPGGFYQGAMDDAASVGMANIIRGMREAGVRRLVALAESGLLEAGQGRLVRDLPTYPAFLRGLAAEHMKAYGLLRSSGLDWTLLCPPRMAPGTRTGRYRVEADSSPPGGGPWHWRMSRYSSWTRC